MKNKNKFKLKIIGKLLQATGTVIVDAAKEIDDDPTVKNKSDKNIESKNETE